MAGVEPSIEGDDVGEKLLYGVESVAVGQLEMSENASGSGLKQDRTGFVRL